ncbi:Uncharacterised protein [Bordetella pertussis]|nr:Uncharacterised protein [Bordetella pertussis]
MFSAPSLDRMFFSSKGRPGSSRADEPVATMTCLATRSASVVPVTLMDQPPSTWPANAPLPWKYVTLFFLNRYRMPSLFCLTTVFLRPISVSSLRLTPLTSMPCSAKWWLACS